MKTNFALPGVDIIWEIGEAILNDVSVRSEFLKLLSSPADRASFGQDFFELFVKRLKTLHGTELAAKLNEDLASAKRVKDANKLKRVHAKHEQLWVAKKKKKMTRTRHKRVDIDLTATTAPAQYTPTAENPNTPATSVPV